MNNTSEPSSVPSAKNVWIMCPSKSHPGLKFYINKETGIKVWNITDSEIAIAEKAGRSDPEPPGMPTMDRPIDAKIYNKQIINNRFSNQLSNMLVNSVPVCPFNVWDNPQNLPPQIQHLPPQIQHQPPQMQHHLQSIVSAAIAPFVDRIEAASKNFSPQPTLHHTSAPYFPNQYEQIRATPQNLSKPRFRKYKWNQRYKNHTSDANNSSRPNDCDSDLRMKLVRKRRFSESFVENDQSNTRNDKSNRIEQELEETSIQVNLKPLKTLTRNSNSDRWYIVVEKDVILENFNYLNNMAAADPDCHILVPHHVMSELRTYVSESNDVQARRILRFLTQQIESGLAILGEEVTVEGFSHKSILTCVKLASRNNNVVVLISSNEETLKYRPHNKDIHVFTMQNIKDILANTSIKVPRPKSPTMSIKIVVPNSIDNENISRDNAHETISQIHFRSNELADSSYLTKNAMEEPLRVSPITGSNEENSPEPVVNKTRMIKSNTEKRVTHENRLPVTVTRQSGASTKLAKTDVSTRSVMGMPPMTNSRFEQIGTHENKLPETVTQKSGASTKLVKTDVSTRSVMGMPPITNSLSEQIGTHENRLPETVTRKSGASTKLAKTEVSTKSVMGMFSMTNPRSEQIGTQENRLPETVTRKSGASTKLAKTDVSTRSVMGMPPMTNSRSEQIYSNSVANSVKGAPIRNELATRSVDYPKTSKKNQHESNSLDSAESFVSLDTVRMKRIISMKNLKSKLNSKAPNEPAKNIVRSRNINKELTPQKIQKTKSASTSASCNKDNTSETSIKRNVSENVIVEETSTSGTVSPVRSEGNEITLRTAHMFSIGGQSMEEVLKTRSDEWVLRFVQIMEEVLRVKLQEKTPFENKVPAPWNLKEAANLILLKFNKYFNVVEAANKLTFILFKVSDKHGKINENILPSDFMEMYSYGVFLIETFMEMSKECTDKDCRLKNPNTQNKYEENDCCSCYEVMTASESLKELLYDIQNANLQTFADNEPSDLATDNPNDFDYSVDYEVREPPVTESQQDEMQCNDNVINYPNLRSQKRKSQRLAVDEVPQEVTIKDKDPKSAFFDSLQLEKSCPTNKDVLSDAKDLKNAEKQNALKNTVLCSIKSVHASDQVHSDSSQNELEDRIGLKCHFSKDDDRDIVKSPSKVIRNFTINVNLERKVKARRIEKEFENYAEETEEADGLNEKNKDVPKTMETNSSKASDDKDASKSPTEVIRDCKINAALKRKVKARRSDKAYNEHAEETEKADGLNENVTDMPKTMETNSSKASDDKDAAKSPTKVIRNFTINADFERKVKARGFGKEFEDYAKKTEEADGLNEKDTNVPKTMETNSSKTSKFKDVAKSPTKVIRNFTINADFERILKARRIEKKCEDYAKETEEADELNEKVTDVAKTIETNSSKTSDDKEAAKSPTEVIRKDKIKAAIKRNLKARRSEKAYNEHAEKNEKADGLNENVTDMPKTIETNSSKASDDNDATKSPTKVIRNFTINADLERKVKTRGIEKECEDYAEKTEEAAGLNENVTDMPKIIETNSSKTSDDKDVAKSTTKVIRNCTINAALKRKLRARRSEEAYDKHTEETEKADGLNENVTDMPKTMETNSSNASDDKDVAKSPTKVNRNFKINAALKRRVKTRRYVKEYENYAEETEADGLNEVTNVPKTMEINGSKTSGEKDIAKSPTKVIRYCKINAAIKRKVKAGRSEEAYNEHAEETEKADGLNEKVTDVPKTMESNGSEASDDKDIKKSPSKSIRNFTINADFERKVKASRYEKDYEYYAEETEEPDVLIEKVTDVPKTMETNGSKASDDKDVAKSPTKAIRNYIKNAALKRKVKARRYEKEYKEYAEEIEEADRLSKTIADMPKTMKANDSKASAIQKEDFNMPKETQYSGYDTPKPNEAVDSPTFIEYSVNNDIDIDIDINSEANKNFMSFIGRLTRRLGDVFTQVKLLCDTYVKELANKHCDVSTRELRQKVEKACMLMGKIQKSLESIGERELHDKDNSIQMLLTIAKVDDFIPDDKLCLEYRHVINKCKEKVEEFQNIVRNVLKQAQG